MRMQWSQVSYKRKLWMSHYYMLIERNKDLKSGMY